MKRRGGGRQGRGVRAGGRPRSLPLPQLPPTCPPADGGGAPRPPGPQADRGGAVRTRSDFLGGRGEGCGEKGKEEGCSSKELFIWGKSFFERGRRGTLASPGPVSTWSLGRLSVGWALVGGPAVF